MVAPKIPPTAGMYLAKEDQVTGSFISGRASGHEDGGIVRRGPVPPAPPPSVQTYHEPLSSKADSAGTPRSALATSSYSLSCHIEGQDMFPPRSVRHLGVVPSEYCSP
jgi:hypothetical protein